MLLEIIRKEVLEHLMGLRFAIALFLCLFVILASLFVRNIDFVQDMDDFHQNTVMDRQSLESIREPWNLPWRPININKQPNPMKLFVRGIEDRNGGVVTLFGMQPARFVSPDISNPAVLLFPFIDMVFIIGVILSLMAVVFGYNVVCGEKENGTLRLMLSYSVPRDQVLLGKWIGGFATLIIPFLITTLGMVAVVFMQRNIAFSQLQWLRFAGVIGLGLLYIAVMYTLSVWVSCLTQKASTSIILLVALWVVLVLVIPNLSPHAASLLADPGAGGAVEKKRTEMIETVLKEKLDDKLKAWEAERGLKPDWRESNVYETDWEKQKLHWLYWQYGAFCQRDAHMTILRENEKLDNQARNRDNTAVALGKWLSRLSPFSCFALASVELADEGTLEKQRFMDQVRAFQVKFLEYTYDEMDKAEAYGLANKGNMMNWVKERKPFPVFVYAPAPGADYLKAVILDTGLLLLMIVVFFLLGYFAFMRYDVR